MSPTNSGGDGYGSRRPPDAVADPAADPVAPSGYASRLGPGRIPSRPMTRDQRTTIVYGILCFILVLLVLQLWLLTATMNAFLGDDHSVIWPAGAASAVCLLLNLGLLRYLYALEQ